MATPEETAPLKRYKSGSVEGGENTKRIPSCASTTRTAPIRRKGYVPARALEESLGLITKSIAKEESEGDF